jgi:hypothetical protein
MSARILSTVFSIATLIALLTAAYLYFVCSEETGFLVEEPERVLEGLSPEVDYEISFRVQNRTGRQVRVVGAAIT